ncbi:hypothetical protein NE547_15790 [Flavonifractor sp. DFI.6.63]|uniref:hypothetical protein n=1 Tax=Flavonifractor sp. DFI.6.63 TaxID=2963704 RepID=UPI00210DEAD5|nr:hypothetical protein [Flavonifractor sp. DFI.6.63]MCQ5030968.1 hypothetical protein [Flavonifractor sp. DFI.6.63]
MEEAVKYCGGCNPRYDRIILVRRLEAALGHSLLPARAGVYYKSLYVICGCTAHCADISALHVGQVIWLDRLIGADADDIQG